MTEGKDFQKETNDPNGELWNRLRYINNEERMPVNCFK